MYNKWHMENYFIFMFSSGLTPDLIHFLYTLLYKTVAFIVTERLPSWFFFVVFVCVVGWLIRFGLCGFFHLYDIRYKNHLTGVSCAVLCNITVIHCFSAQNSFRFKLEKKDRKSLSWFLHCLKCNTFFVT